MDSQPGPRRRRASRANVVYNRIYYRARRARTMPKTTSEPIAIVGMACRFPGADGIEAFWRLLEAGRTAVTEGVPGSGLGRVGELFPYPEVQGAACRFGAYLDEVDRFDASFFRISPVEAQLLDPQQRMMLETSWQALEDACIDPDTLKGSRTGVYGGISNNEYRGLVLATDDTAEPARSLYSVTGTSFNTAIGRVAYALGLEGPAIALDTACSSSLVAIHQAVAGLERGEADLALAGGVHVILSGRLLEMRAAAGMLSPDGRCATFDAAANGYVRGEGCGIVVLKRLAEAQAGGDRIWAVIRGSAVNQDGASPGLTVPNGAAQQRVIGDALGRAGLCPAEVDYVEAHGTGTEVGDPIEARATGTAYGAGRTHGDPLLIGSVKTNIGHLEAAAGVAAFIKVVLSMRHGTIPRHLHFREPTPQVEWDALPLRVTAERTEWPQRPERPRTAGVSGFGWSGTNAHMVLQGYEGRRGGREGFGWWRPPDGASLPVRVETGAGEAAPSVTPAARARKARLLPLSGRSDGALRELAGRYLAWLDSHARRLSPGAAPELRSGESLLADMAWTAAAGRSHFSRRAGLVFRDAAALRRACEALAAGSAEPRARPARDDWKIAFAYTGQGSQWVGMGGGLYETEPVARAVLDRCETAYHEVTGASLLGVMFGRTESGGELDDPAWTQPAIYTLECAVAALWASIGIQPDVVVGHSLGEIAAAHGAGVFGLEDGLRFAAARGALMAGLSEEGAMAAVFASASEVAAAVEAHNSATPGPGVSIAADNGAHQAVSGPAAGVEAVLEPFEAEGVRVRRLRRSPPYHSALVEPALDDVEAAISDVPLAPPSVEFVSTLTGRALEPGATLDGAYWRAQARERVALRKAVRTLSGSGVDVVVEIGPHSVLGPMLALAWPEPDGGCPPEVIASLLRPGRRVSQAESEDAFAVAVARAYEIGLPVSLPGLFAGESRRRISVPGYPFRRERHWVRASRRRRTGGDHPLLGTRHESASGEISFETEVFPSDPAWMADHSVFDRVVAPGALYGAMAVSACLGESRGAQSIDDMQLKSPLVLPDGESANGAGGTGRTMQVLLDPAGGGGSRRVRILSRGGDGEEWAVHAECRVSPGSADAEGSRVDLGNLRADLAPQDVTAFYRAKTKVGIDLGPSFRTLARVWSRPREAVGEVVVPSGLDGAGAEVHPLLLDGCFQVMSAARGPAGSEEGISYLPFGWERLWIAARLPDRVFCHARMHDALREETTESGDGSRSGSAGGDPAEVLTGDLRIYDQSGFLLGGLSGYTMKRATRAALLSAVEGLGKLLYEVTWRDSALPPGMPAADFLPEPATVAAGSPPFGEYLANEGVAADDRDSLLDDLETVSRSYALLALDRLGWKRTAGDVVDPAALRGSLGVLDEHERLFHRMLELLARSGVLDEAGEGFRVIAGSGDPLPGGLPPDPDAFAAAMAGRYSHGSTEIGLFRRNGDALAEVLTGSEDPLTLLFSSGEPTAADLYLKAPVARAANRMLGDAVRALVAGLPAGRQLRVIEVGAGTGSATASVLPELPDGGFDYVYTDISAGFFAEAEARFSETGALIDYRVLDIEKDPVEQGFHRHGYDLLIASNVLHATRYLDETLAHCLNLLAPSGQLVALENLRSQGWLDLTFGQLDGWWRFADSYRPKHALASPEVWKRALADAGFGEAEVLGPEVSDATAEPDRGVIVAQGPVEVVERPGAWVVAADGSGAGKRVAAELAARNQTVVLAGPGAIAPGQRAGSGDRAGTAAPDSPGIRQAAVETGQRESWRALLGEIPDDPPLRGIVHLAALDARGPAATTSEMADDSEHVAASALALLQGVADSDAVPTNGVWMLTRGAQVLDCERSGRLAGALLWGIGKVVAKEYPHLQPRMIDLDPGSGSSPSVLANELLHPDAETHIAYRAGLRRVARLVRAGAGAERLSLPEGTDWLLEPDPAGALEKLGVEPLPPRVLGPRDVRIAVEATGLNFWDVFRSIGFIDEGLLGGEFCGTVLEIGSGVSTVSTGERVVGLAFGTFGPEAVTHEEMVCAVPPGVSVTALATLPTAFVSADLSYEVARLEAGDRVLIHAGAGGVGLAAIQLAQSTGAEVFATASARKRDYLRSLGVEHVFDSRRTDFGEGILEATDGSGVDVVLNSLTGEGFIEASLSCLAEGGRFVELARRDILSEGEIAAVRPDVDYHVLELDTLKEHDPAWPGTSLRRVMAQLAAGEIEPLVHSRWPLAEAGAAMRFMRAARHIGKIVFTNSPLAQSRLRADRTYLVTGGLGGIGCVVARWLAEHGAGAIVLNGRRAPDADAEETIAALRDRGATVRVELADVTDADAVDAMLAGMDLDLPPLGGVIHSVGVLADQSLGNQSWERFERVLRPKVLGAWHLHRATLDRDLDMFVLFSSVAGVLGNAGQANHSAANSFLDQLAAHRRAHGLAGQAIAWGAWSGLGEAEEQRERIARQLGASGTGWISPEQGLRAFGRIVRQDVATAVVAAVDWPIYGEAFEYHPPLLADLLVAASDSKGDAPALAEALMSTYRTTPAAGREALLVAFLQEEVQAVLRLPAPPPPNVAFFDLGMDSLMAVELRNRLNRTLAGEYAAPNTVVFDYPDIAGLAEHLVFELDGGDGVSPPTADLRSEPDARPEAGLGDEGIAIVGMACRFPRSPDLAAFWDLLDNGVDAVTDGRQDSGDWAGVTGDPAARAAYVRRGAFLEHIDRFDARFFRIQPVQARTMDPRQRILLETTWHALEDAAIDPGRLKGTATGVFVGVGHGDYRELAAAAGEAHGYLGTTASVTTGRIAFTLGLTGPALPVDMACASSLAAVHQAASALRQGEVELALVGGVNAILSPGIAAFLAETGMLSRRGRCSTFDAEADGFVRGEGCGVVVLKRLGDAEADGDRIWGVIRGSAVNQSGATAGLTIPSGPAQERVIREALARAGVPPGEVDYLEAHGGGSDLGDPIEVLAAAAAYGLERDPARPLLMGSVKTNIGHQECAAGIASLIKTVLAMNGGRIPEHLHFSNPSPHLDWDRLPVRVTAEATDWPTASGRPPRAGVSAFGLQGTNAHVVVEGVPGRGEAAAGGGASAGLRSPEGRPRPVSTAMPEPFAHLRPATEGLASRTARVLPLSGQSGGATRKLARRYLEWLGIQTDPTWMLLSDMAYTAGTGRSHFAHRTGIVFRDADSLLAGLEAAAKHDGGPGSPGMPEPPTPPKTVFVYRGGSTGFAPQAREMYETEPVVRAVLDRCDTVFQEERRRGSLLEVMLGNGNANRRLEDPEWAEPAAYAFACALTALWASVGVRPDVVAWSGPGELAAAQAAEVFTLEDGLRLALVQGVLTAAPKSRVAAAVPGADAAGEGLGTIDGLKTARSRIALSVPSRTIVEPVAGLALGVDHACDTAYWLGQGRPVRETGELASALASLDVRLVLEIGAASSPGPVALRDWTQGGTDAPYTFAESTARAYEAGLGVSFEALFAGESRRRISLPNYPFQRRRHWFGPVR